MVKLWFSSLSFPITLPCPIHSLLRIRWFTGKIFYFAILYNLIICLLNRTHWLCKVDSTQQFFVNTFYSSGKKTLKFTA